MYTRYITNEHKSDLQKLSRILRKKVRKTNKAELIITSLSVFLLLWGLASYINAMINIDNQTYNYAWWNLLTLITLLF